MKKTERVFFVASSRMGMRTASTFSCTCCGKVPTNSGPWPANFSGGRPGVVKGADATNHKKNPDVRSDQAEKKGDETPHPFFDVFFC
jgi:hypothetical protein